MYLDRSAQETPVIALGAAAREDLRLADVLETMLQGVRDAFEKPDRRQISETKRLDEVLSAFVPWHRNRDKRFYRSGCLQDSERYRRATHMAKAARRCRNMLAHARPAAEKVSEFIVPSAIPSC